MFRVDQFGAPEGNSESVWRAEGALEPLVAAVVAWLVDCGYSPGTTRVVADMFDRFVRFSAAHSAHHVGEVTAELAEGFVRAVGVDGASPAVATMHQRRSVLRLFYRVLRLADPLVVDPTWGLMLPPAGAATQRPVTDAELDLLRSVALAMVGETRLPAVVALAEASATSMEITRVTTTDVDPDRGTVTLPGSRGVSPRIGHLTDWGATQLTRRLHQLHRTNTLVAASDTGRGNPTQASISVTLRRLFDRAGLSSEPDLGLGSVRAWAGRRAFDTTGRVEAAATVLGCRSLDTTARLIGWDWQDPP